VITVIIHTMARYVALQIVAVLCKALSQYQSVRLTTALMCNAI
jgi:hypothetical protein